MAVILYDHSFGKQEQQDLVVCRPYAIPESFEEAEMLDQGWLALDKPIYHEGRWQECFYQSRATRLNLKNYRAPKRTPQYGGKKIELMEIIPNTDNVAMTGLTRIYNKYIKRTGFADLYSPFEHIRDRDSFLIYYQDDVTNIIGFSKIKRYWFQEELLSYNNRRDLHKLHPNQCVAVESVLHANTVPISKITVDMEATWAKKQNIRDLYLGSGYELGSVYKSTYRGFEWWTGTEWSRNKDKFVKLCQRDSRIKKIKDLSNLQHF